MINIDNTIEVHSCTNNAAVHSGQGEYIVFTNSPQGSQSLDPSYFDRVYQIFAKYSLHEIAARTSPSELPDQCEHRYDLIQREVSEISADLTISFVPKVLFELIFLRVSIDENCEDLSSFNNANEAEREDMVRCVAYQLNQRLIEILHPTKCGFDLNELYRFTVEQLDYFVQYHLDCQRLSPPPSETEEVNVWLTRNVNTPRFSFGYTLSDLEVCGYLAKKCSLLTISTPEEQQMCLTALQYECSLLANYSVFLYRGSDFSKDTVLKIGPSPSAKWIVSLSFGTGLFAGAIQDPGATAWGYMRTSSDAVIIPVPIEEIHSCPFYIPSTNTITQLLSSGEMFHARSKVCKNFEKFTPLGFGSIGTLFLHGSEKQHAISLLRSTLGIEELQERVDEYKAKALSLKGTPRHNNLMFDR